MHSRRSFTGALLGFSASQSLPAAAADPAWMGIAEGGGLLRRKKLSPIEWTKACLDRIEKLNPRLNAFITVTAEQALADARRMESELQAGKVRGPLHGVPIALKDLIDTTGIRT
ncbi:MAG TPA: amidase family protein, partial [Bryobacteraceae bacterium]|nr:amidase family protein [Bryobacteraceae bacterium]